MFFRFKPFEGPARFRWKDPDTGHKFEEPTKEALITRINSYRAQNNLEAIEALPFVLESYWCGLPENAYKCVPVEVTPRGMLGYIKGGVALLKNLWYGKFASKSVADVRSGQCSECQFNVFPDRNGFIKWSDDIAVASVGERRSSNHDKLGICAVCSCPLRAKVFYTGKVENNPEWRSKFESVKCWQLELMGKRG